MRWVERADWVAWEGVRVEDEEGLWVGVVSWCLGKERQSVRVGVREGRVV